MNQRGMDYITFEMVRRLVMVHFGLSEEETQTGIDECFRIVDMMHVERNQSNIPRLLRQ